MEDGASRKPSQRVLLDDNFMEFTEVSTHTQHLARTVSRFTLQSQGRPLPLHDRAKEYFNRAVNNDSLFLSLINVVDYSILVGIDEENKEVAIRTRRTLVGHDLAFAVHDFDLAFGSWWSGSSIT